MVLRESEEVSSYGFVCARNSCLNTRVNGGGKFLRYTFSNGSLIDYCLKCKGVDYRPSGTSAWRSYVKRPRWLEMRLVAARLGV